MSAQLQGHQGFAVIWRNVQRARSELLGLWFFRFFRSLRKLANPAFSSSHTARPLRNMRIHSIRPAEKKYHQR
jgi:hypothetical protein